MSVRQPTFEELTAGLRHIEDSPDDGGVLRLIVRRPAIGAREAVQQAELDDEVGLVGDSWHTRSPWWRKGGPPSRDSQITIINARAIALIAQSDDLWALAGDQLYLDLDLSDENLPAGTRLAVGTAVIEVTAQPHTGCRKFSARFGADAARFVNSKDGRRLRLRGINAKVVQPGTIRVGDVATKIPENQAI